MPYRAALEDLAIPCFLGGMARGMLGRDSPLHIHQNRREALKEADVVILAGEWGPVQPMGQGRAGHPMSWAVQVMLPDRQRGGRAWW